MKLKLFFFFLLLFPFSFVNAELVIFSNPTASDIKQHSYYWPTSSILTSNPTAKIFFWNQQYHQFCLQNGWTYVSSTTSSINEFPKIAFSNTWYLYNWPNQWTVTSITCDIPSIPLYSPFSWTGTYIEIAYQWNDWWYYINKNSIIDLIIIIAFSFIVLFTLTALTIKTFNLWKN